MTHRTLLLATALLAAATTTPAGAQAPAHDARLVAHFPSPAAPAMPAALAAPALADERTRTPTFSRRDLAYWGTALAIGAVVYQFDERLVEGTPDTVDKANGGLDYAALRLAPFNEYKAFYGAVALYGYGRLAGKGTLAEMGLHASEAALLGKIGMDLGRGLAGRSRPKTLIELGQPADRADFELARGFGETGYGAFPSRHVTGVSAVASALAFETRHHFPRHSRWVTPLAVVTPLVIGLGRMHTRHHWGTDVVAGYALGTWLGWKTVAYNHGHPNSWLDRLLLADR